jgi:hypothetical protein
MIYTDSHVNAAIARVEAAKQNNPVGWKFLDEVGLRPADTFVAYAFVNADAHAARLVGEDPRVIYATGWLQGLAIGVALAEGVWRQDSEAADVASMQAAFWRNRAIGLGADSNDWKRHERAAFAAE